MLNNTVRQQLGYDVWQGKTPLLTLPLGGSEDNIKAIVAVLHSVGADRSYCAGPEGCVEVGKKA